MSKLVAIAVLGLAACTHGPREVRVPLAVPCLDPRDVPVEVAPAGLLPSDARAAADLLAAKVLELRGTDRELRALLRGCAQ